MTLDSISACEVGVPNWKICSKLIYRALELIIVHILRENYDPANAFCGLLKDLVVAERKRDIVKLKICEYYMPTKVLSQTMNTFCSLSLQ